ncbi:hypothetical protein AMTRI_Chr10g1450 [Amborella trichopoda]
MPARVWGFSTPTAVMDCSLNGRLGRSSKVSNLRHLMPEKPEGACSLSRTLYGYKLSPRNTLFPLFPRNTSSLPFPWSSSASVLHRIHLSQSHSAASYPENHCASTSGGKMALSSTRLHNIRANNI